MMLEVFAVRIPVRGWTLKGRKRGCLRNRFLATRPNSAEAFLIYTLLRCEIVCVQQPSRLSFNERGTQAEYRNHMIQRNTGGKVG
jgi:hypothetical protein